MENQNQGPNSTEKLMKLLEDKKVVKCKLIFKKKKGTRGVEKARYKAILVVKGQNQISSADFTDVFFLVVKHNSIQALFGIVAIQDLELQ